MRCFARRLMLLRPSPRFYFNDPPPTDIYTLSPTRRSSDLIEERVREAVEALAVDVRAEVAVGADRLDLLVPGEQEVDLEQDRKSTRLNSSHVEISYAVFCLKKKTRTINRHTSFTPSPFASL